ncbi:MAG: hypothetical protein EB039_15785, partial [Proteobacteria bacterium]|nr:hypothetical protein [Pseudomonadota bacterium]
MANARQLRFALLALVAGSWCVASSFGQGQVVGWGQGIAGSLIPGSSSLLRFSRLAAGQHGTLAMRRDGTISSWGEMPQPSVPFAAVAIGAGLWHGVALVPDGSVVCWGSNTNGQSSVPSGLRPVVSVAGGGSHTIVATIDGDAVCWGSDDEGQCSTPSDLQGVRSVAAGYSHSLAMTLAGQVTCWGANAFGPPVIGNEYTSHFSDAWDVAMHAVPCLEALENRSLAFVHTVTMSDLPSEVQEAALFNISTLRSQTCFRTPDGNFWGWEGTFDHTGSCYGSCTHVWNYEQTVPFLFGQLARTARRLEFIEGTRDDGHMAFRIALPLDLP